MPSGRVFRLNDEAVVLAGDLHLAGRQILDRMVCATMAVMHLLGLGAERQRQHLVAEADPEDRQARRQDFPDCGHRVFAGRGRIARAVRQEDAVRVVLQDVVGGRGGRHDGDVTAQVREAAQDVPLRAVVDRDDAPCRIVLRAVALAQCPARFGPFIGLRAAYLFCQVHAFQAGPFGRRAAEGGDVELSIRRMRERCVRRAEIADPRRQRARVDPADADQPLRGQPIVKMLRGAPVRRFGDVRAQHAATRGGRQRFDVFRIRTGVADMREGEGDDLAGVGRVGQDLLIPRHRGVEADFADRIAGSAEPLTPKNRAIRQD